MIDDHVAIRARVLRAIALNRTPGYHFPGNFLEISFDAVAPEASELSIDVGGHCVTAGGVAHLGAIAMLADLALSATIRAGLELHQRLGTVSLTLQLNGTPANGRIVARSEFQGMVANARGRQGMARVTLSGDGGALGSGLGSFMVLNPPRDVQLQPIPHRKHTDPQALAADETSLNDRERVVLARADAAIASASGARSFAEHFWGASGLVENGPHMGNRVGHMQGGLLLAFAASTAATALGAAPTTKSISSNVANPAWCLTQITAAYVSPGEGALLRAESTVFHRGGLTAVVRTQVLGIEERLVLDVVSHHAALNR